MSTSDSKYHQDDGHQTTSIYFCDFHIHVGRSLGRPVKMAAAPSLTVHNILEHARVRKGLDVITLIDGVCTSVLGELQEMEQAGQLRRLPDGGLLHENGLVVLPGSEVEIGGPQGGAAHFGCWFSSTEQADSFRQWLATVQKNVSLSSQRAYTDAKTLQERVRDHGGMFIVHHAFTPHKGILGNCVNRLSEMLDIELVDALELGLSADTEMGDCIAELSGLTYITNSDAHSLPKIAREYNAIHMSAPSFNQVRDAFHRRNGRGVVANYGLSPKLGKYHRTYCKACGSLWEVGAESCACGSQKRVPGVYDRLLEIADIDVPQVVDHRPPYVYQIPLEYVPGLGPKMRAKLYECIGPEMKVLHSATRNDLAAVVGDAMADRIDAARTGRMDIQTGGGGLYGKLVLND